MGYNILYPYSMVLVSSREFDKEDPSRWASIGIHVCEHLPGHGSPQRGSLGVEIAHPHPALSREPAPWSVG